MHGGHISCAAWKVITQTIRPNKVSPLLARITSAI